MPTNKLDKSFFYKGFKPILLTRYGKEQAETIWGMAGKHYEVLYKAHDDCDKDSKALIMPAAAVYQAAPDALPLLIEYATALGSRIGRAVHGITSLPGVSRLLWRNMPKLMRSMSSPEKGYERRIVSETQELVAVDILACPLHQAAIQMGVPEVAAVVCAMDKAYMTGFKYIEYTRSTALGNGDEFCDYRLHFDKNKR